MVILVAGETAQIHFTGMLYNQPLGENFSGAKYAPVPIPMLYPTTLEPLSY